MINSDSVNGSTNVVEQASSSVAWQQNVPRSNIESTSARGSTTSATYPETLSDSLSTPPATTCATTCATISVGNRKHRSKSALPSPPIRTIQRFRHISPVPQSRPGGLRRSRYSSTPPPPETVVETVTYDDTDANGRPVRITQTIQETVEYFDASSQDLLAKPPPVSITSPTEPPDDSTRRTSYGSGLGLGLVRNGPLGSARAYPLGPPIVINEPSVYSSSLSLSSSSPRLRARPLWAASPLSNPPTQPLNRRSMRLSSDVFADDSQHSFGVVFDSQHSTPAHSTLSHSTANLVPSSGHSDSAFTYAKKIDSGNLVLPESKTTRDPQHPDFTMTQSLYEPTQMGNGVVLKTGTDIDRLNGEQYTSSIVHMNRVENDSNKMSGTTPYGGQGTSV